MSDTHTKRNNSAARYAKFAAGKWRPVPLDPEFQKLVDEVGRRLNYDNRSTALRSIIIVGSRLAVDDLSRFVELLATQEN